MKIKYKKIISKMKIIKIIPNQKKKKKKKKKIIPHPEMN